MTIMAVEGELRLKAPLQFVSAYRDSSLGFGFTADLTDHEILYCTVTAVVTATHPQPASPIVLRLASAQYHAIVNSTV